MIAAVCAHCGRDLPPGRAGWCEQTCLRWANAQGIRFPRGPQKRSCVDCPATFEVTPGKRGPVARRCPTCSRARHGAQRKRSAALRRQGLTANRPAVYGGSVS